MTHNEEATRYYSRKQEERLAKLIGGKVVPNSGATSFKKGDISNEYLLLEAKTLVEPKKSRSIKKEWLTGLKKEAFEEKKPLSALAFDFGDGEDYFILNKRDFLNLYQTWREVMESED